MKDNNVVKDQSFLFALRIVRLTRYLNIANGSNFQVCEVHLPIQSPPCERGFRGIVRIVLDRKLPYIRSGYLPENRRSPPAPLKNGGAGIGGDFWVFTGFDIINR